MPLLVAFASLPFGIRERTYTVHGTSGQLTVHVSEQKFSPLIAVSPSGSATDDAPPTDPWSTTYTWYDHPFVLQVIFGVDHATLGSINSTATVIRRLAEGIALD
ncbi:MAG: hypothetical protein GXY79_03045, partial [Chloroflexi bacterium]|nr:hypothetical protein [Chloroflexota bacterium]